MSKKTRYILTAAIGDQLAGTVIELTAEQAESPLYASRIGEPTEAGTATGPSYDEMRAQILGELESQVPDFLADAKREREEKLADTKAQAAQIVSDAQTEADKLREAAKTESKDLVDKAKAEATKLVTDAQAEAMKLATAPKK